MNTKISELYNIPLENLKVWKKESSLNEKIATEISSEENCLYRIKDFNIRHNNMIFAEKVKN